MCKILKELGALEIGKAMDQSQKNTQLRIGIQNKRGCHDGMWVAS